ncbi:hypothetical protein I3271_03260 [Photobacterium leiognathi]|uniref:hypothetical protein n=1 Tax=Photobacterium leiognathi TaxID=553611 RepID=UPI001EE0A6DA|nr:hypothetical protein [Photobacterium leiognathi]MCG3883700.1 hypothetical protein [Photobacterium leiognathi]
MRISSNTLFANLATSISTNMDRTVHTSNNMYYKIHKAGDDPAAQSQIMLLQTTMNTNMAYSESAKHATTITKESESYVMGYRKATEDYLALTEKAINGTSNAEDKRAFAKELNEIIEQVALLSNSKSYTGDFVFGGNMSGTPPFEFTHNSNGNIDSFKYNGNDIQKEVSIGKNLYSKVSYDGSKIFSNKDGESVFEGLMEMRDKLEKGESFSPEEATRLKAKAKSFNDAAIIQTTDVAVGIAQIETTTKRYELLDLSYSKQLSLLQDSDFAQVSVDLARFKNMTKSSISTMQTILKMTEDIISM